MELDFSLSCRLYKERIDIVYNSLGTELSKQEARTWPSPYNFQEYFRILDVDTSSLGYCRLTLNSFSINFLSKSFLRYTIKRRQWCLECAGFHLTSPRSLRCMPRDLHNNNNSTWYSVLKAFKVSVVLCNVWWTLLSNLWLEILKQTNYFKPSVVSVF